MGTNMPDFLANFKMATGMPQLNKFVKKKQKTILLLLVLWLLIIKSSLPAGDREWGKSTVDMEQLYEKHRKLPQNLSEAASS